MFKMTEAALGGPDRLVSEVIYPAVPGGAETLAALLQEYRTQGTGYRQHKQRVFKASYTSHYRKGLIQLLDALEFGSTNTAHAPMMEALALIKRYSSQAAGNTQYYARGEHVPVDGVVPADLRELMYRADKRGQMRILRSVYECGVFQTLREQLRCKEIWVVGADKWRSGSPSKRSYAWEEAGIIAGHGSRVPVHPVSPGAALTCATPVKWRPHSGVTPTRTCPPTSRPAGPRTTASCASRWMPASSPASCGRRWTPS